RSRLASESCLLVPGVYDCISALVAQQAGFGAVAISGYAVEASLLGRPDLGFTGLTDIEGVTRRIAAAVQVPVICDADTGYGDAKHVGETVRRLEAAGAAALHIEDQADPKRCGGMSGREVVGVEAMTAKIRAAVDARCTEDFLVIGRTDALESRGLQAAAERLNRYAEAGADVVFAGESYTPAQLRALTSRVEAPLAICAGIPGWSASFETQET
ncbi:MAG: carboxyvinyl-carboxyphosphonate phosphorylmutase, partial [Solirubrobacterales bacterium]|nr:carboxyvinyl-carboxyphosphonate phosphorylmutase [Solirubrobacterales bacterium]